jgi:Ca-activated chloride channel family protein
MPVALLLSCIFAFGLSAQSHPHDKLPKPRRLDPLNGWTRDLSTGELNASAGAPRPANGDVAAVRPISVTTQIVPVTCSVSDAMGAAVRNIPRSDFRVYDNGVLQQISYFDASADPAGVALVMDASPSVLRESADMKNAARMLVDSLASSDQIAVVDFSAHTYLQLPFSNDWGLIRKAVTRVDARSLLSDTGGSNIYESLFLVARELFVGRKGRKAIVLLTDGQDSGLGLTLDPATASPRPGWPRDRLTFEDVARALASADIQVFAVSTESRPKIMTPDWLAAHADTTLLDSTARKGQIPAYTLYLAELTRRTGGHLYFLREANTLADTFQQIALKIRAEYTLGFSPVSPQAGIPTPGWHELRAEVSGHGDPKIVYRTAYYVPPVR